MYIRLYLFLACIFLFQGCSRNNNKEIIVASKHDQHGDSIEFTIKPTNRKIIIPVALNDTLTAKMLLDTGIGGAQGTRNFILDSAFVASKSITISGVPENRQYGMMWIT